jgi:hypothetical protein
VWGGLLLFCRKNLFLCRHENYFSTRETFNAAAGLRFGLAFSKTIGSMTSSVPKTVFAAPLVSRIHSISKQWPRGIVLLGFVLTCLWIVLLSWIPMRLILSLT